MLIFRVFVLLKFFLPITNMKFVGPITDTSLKQADGESIVE